jgi:hypothetical protein
VVVFLFYFLGVGWDWVHLAHRPLTGLLYQPGMIGDDECVAVGGMKIGRGNRSTRRKFAPMPLCTPQIPHDLKWPQTRAFGVGSRRLTAWARARSLNKVNKYLLLLVFLLSGNKSFSVELASYNLTSMSNVMEVGHLALCLLQRTKEPRHVYEHGSTVSAWLAQYAS